MEQRPVHQKAVGWIPCPSVYGRQPIDVLLTLSSINIPSVRISKSKFNNGNIILHSQARHNSGFLARAEDTSVAEQASAVFYHPRVGAELDKGVSAPEDDS